MVFPWVITLALAVVGQFFLVQIHQSWPLWAGLFFYAAAFWKLNRLSLPAQPSPAFSRKTEIVLFLLILALAFFFRIYRIDSIPSGMHTDQGLTGLCALRILHEGWRPFFEALNYQVPEPVLFYQLAGWFGLVGSSFLTFHLFFILLSLASFPLVYWTFRQWAGPRVALLSLFLLAVARWHWIMARNGYPSLQTPFYLFGALGFWTHWIQSGKKSSLYLSALFVGVGLYTYQAFKVVLLLLVLLALYEIFTRPKKKKSKASFVPYFLAVLVLAAPLLFYMGQQKSFGNREGQLFVGTKMWEEKSLKPLLDSFTATALMLNHKGDPNPRHNLPGRRMLDDATGLFFILGLALAWHGQKAKKFAYPLLGFGVMALPGILATDAPHANRLVALLPFVVYFAATAMDFFWQGMAQALKNKRGFLVPVAVLILAGLTASNAWTYFVEQARNEDCWRSFDPSAATIGKTIDRLNRTSPGELYYLVDPLYFRNNTVAFLTDGAKRDVLPFSLEGAVYNKFPNDRNLCFFLGENKWGQSEFLNTIFPFAARTEPNRFEEKLKSPLGQVVLCSRYVPKEALKVFRGWDRGLEGTYIQGSDWKAPSLAKMREPVLNFTSKMDFLFTDYPPFRIRWTGTLEISKAGHYRFQVLTTDRARLWIGGKAVPLESPLLLKARVYSVKLEYEKDGGDEMALNLLWSRPGEDKWEVVPATAFGKLH